MPRGTRKAPASNERVNEVAEKEHAEQQEAEQRSSPSGKIIYKAIQKEGEEELERHSTALLWSGLAAGLSMGFCMITEGLLAAHLPHTDWKPLLVKFGYCVGFLIVILGRQQLFTENTLTAVLVLLKKKDGPTLLNVMRLWGIVLLANLVGALAVALVAAHTTAFSSQARDAFAEIGRTAMQPDFGTVLLRGIFAGWLIALMVWLLPFAESGRIWVIIVITYVVGIANFSHIIAGSVETFTLASMGLESWLTVLGAWVLPTLIGNILGGVALVAFLNHSQVTAGGTND